MNPPCAFCQAPVDPTQPHGRQAVLDAQGIARRGEWVAVHLTCERPMQPPVPETSDPDQLTLDTSI